MPTEAIELVHAGEVAEVTASIFETMFGLAVEHEDSKCPAAADLLTAAVYVSGAWRGAVLVHSLPSQARCFTGAYLGLPTPDQVDDDVRDVLGEIANMIAGNLKCVLYPGAALSMPSVITGSTDALRVCRGRVAYELGFITFDGPFWITVIESLEPAESGIL